MWGHNPALVPFVSETYVLGPSSSSSSSLTWVDGRFPERNYENTGTNIVTARARPGFPTVLKSVLLYQPWMCVLTEKDIT